ncbi:MAG TPA: universal stress protein [Candidatus Saccharimonadales bacterium]|nr:universal stress protein [Candidatus Saccharimonadales bacterium]
MVINNEIVPTNESDVIASKDLDKSETEVKQASSGSSDSIIGSIIPSFNKLLVTSDGTNNSDKAINYAIYLSNFTNAEIVILQVIGNIDKLENSSMNISNRNRDINKETSPSNIGDSESEIRNDNYSINVEGEIVKSLEVKIKEIEKTGCKNKVSYKIRAGFIVDEIVKETTESKYDLLVISSSHMDSWIKSLFSETRKIISNVDLPVLLLH